MKILVLSDSHGNISNMEAAVEREQPRMILHLGDCWRDAERLAERYPEIPMEHVPGNCDYAPTVPQMLTLEFDGVRIFATHGHLFGVKRELTALADAARERGAQIGLRFRACILAHICVSFSIQI